MLILALFGAATVAQPEQAPQAAAQQARATVRIVSGERIRAGERPPREALVRRVKVKLADGSHAPADLIEFP